MFVQSIYLFISVVETGSFSKAAKIHYMSQSAVSQQIAKLEKNLGFLVFDRNGYRPVLTKAGKYYYDHCKKLLEEYERIEKESVKIAKNAKDKLVIGITRGFEMKIVTSLIKEYNKNHDIKAEIRINSSRENMNLLRQGDIDLAFGYDYTIDEAENFNIEKLYRYNLCAIAPAEGKWKDIDEISFKDLNQVPVVLLSKTTGPKTYENYLSSCKINNIEPMISRETDNIYELTTAVSLNEGIAYIAKELVNIDNDLKFIEIKDNTFTCDFCLTYFSTEEKLKELVQYICEYFHKL